MTLRRSPRKRRWQKSSLHIKQCLSSRVAKTFQNHAVQQTPFNQVRNIREKLAGYFSRRAARRDRVRAVRGRRGRHRHLYRPANRRAAATPRARVRGHDRRENQRHHRAFSRLVPANLYRRFDRQQQLRRLCVRAAVVGRLRRARLFRGLDRAYSERRRHPVGRRRPLLPRLFLDVSRLGLHPSLGRRLPDGLLPHRRAERPRHGAARNLGRLLSHRRGRQRDGHERGRRRGLRQLHRQGAQQPGLLVYHLHRRADVADARHLAGRVFSTTRP